MLLHQKIITRADLRANREALYLFGDNLERRGLGGQAREMRGEPNAVGVATKKRPSRNPEDYYTDDEFAQNMVQIRRDLRLPLLRLRAGGVVVCPLDGLGTGRAGLHRHAPRTFGALSSLLEEMAEVSAKMLWSARLEGVLR